MGLGCDGGGSGECRVGSSNDLRVVVEEWLLVDGLRVGGLLAVEELDDDRHHVRVLLAHLTLKGLVILLLALDCLLQLENEGEESVVGGGGGGGRGRGGR